MIDPKLSNNPASGKAALSNDSPIPTAVLPPSVASLCDGILRDVATNLPADIQPGEVKK